MSRRVSSSRRWSTALAALLLAACSRLEPVHPALWEVTGPGGQKAWLFGTIHALPDPVDWRSGPVDAALNASDRVVLEVAAIRDGAAIGQEIERLGAAPASLPLRERVRPELRPTYDALIRQLKIDETALASRDTWAAALALAQAAQRGEGTDPANGIDRALAASGKPLGELEGATAQLQIFDTLPESEQRDLLAAVIREEPERDLTRAWKSGDLAPLEQATREGMLADPELREALYAERNRRWTVRLVEAMRGGGHPFVAVGGMHLVGPEGLPTLLAARGYTVRRVQ